MRAADQLDEQVNPGIIGQIWVVLQTPDLYRVNPQFIAFPITYRRSQGLLTPLSA
jgi:hypothetical protein